MNKYKLSTDPNDDQAMAVTMSKREFRILHNVLWNIQWGNSEIGNVLREFCKINEDHIHDCVELNLWAESDEGFPIIADNAALPE